MPQQNPFQHTASTFQAVTGISIEPGHIELILRLHRVSSFWGRTNKVAADITPAANMPPPAKPDAVLKLTGTAFEFMAAGEELPTSAVAALCASTGLSPVDFKPKKVETGTIEEPLHLPPIKSGEHSYISSSFSSDPYYPWQIVVICRDKDPANSYAVNYSTRPTMEEFAEHYAKYENRTHWVHVNDFTSREKKVVSETFWAELKAFRDAPKAGPVQEAQAGKVSAEEKPFKLTYFVGANQTADKYFDTAPAAWVIAYHHNAYGKAFVTEQK